MIGTPTRPNTMASVEELFGMAEYAQRAGREGLAIELLCECIRHACASPAAVVETRSDLGLALRAFVTDFGGDG